MFDFLFRHSEESLKLWAKIEGIVITAIAVIIFGLFATSPYMRGGEIVLLLVLILLLWFVAMISVWTLYAFADLVESNREMQQELSQMSDGLADYTQANNQVIHAMSRDLALIARHICAPDEAAKPEPDPEAAAPEEEALAQLPAAQNENKEDI